MAAPKDIHKFLLGKGFRSVGMGDYCKFMSDDKPVAWTVCVNSFKARGEKFLDIFLHLRVPDGYLNPVETLCTDGLLRAYTSALNKIDLFAHRADNPEQTVELLNLSMWRWFDVIANADIMLALLDFKMGISCSLPQSFSHLANYFTDRPRGECFADMREKLLYLMLADRYEEAESILLDNAMLKNWKMDDDYQMLLACARRKSLVTEEFAAWVDKKKLAPNRKW